MVSRSGLTVAKGQIFVSTTSLEKRKIAGVLVCLRKYVGGAKNGADLSHDDPPEFYYRSLNFEKWLSSSRFSELRDPWGREGQSRSSVSCFEWRKVVNNGGGWAVADRRRV